MLCAVFVVCCCFVVDDDCLLSALFAVCCLLFVVCFVFRVVWVVCYCSCCSRCWLLLVDVVLVVVGLLLVMM